MTRAIHVKRTWGSRCDILLFMSSQQGSISLGNPNFSLQSLPRRCLQTTGWEQWLCQESKMVMTSCGPKLRQHSNTFRTGRNIHRDGAPSSARFFRADDDFFVFADNLRTFLGRHDPREAHYLGYAVEYNPEVVVNLGFSEFTFSKNNYLQPYLQSLSSAGFCRFRNKQRGTSDIHPRIAPISRRMLPRYPANTQRRR